MIKATKIAYVSPPHGELVLTLIHDANPRATLTLDLGIPNFTVFSMTLPLAEGEPKAMSELIAESVHVLLDEVASFMLSMEYEDAVIKLIYATVLTCFKGMSQEADTSKEQDESGQDPTVKMFEGTFDIPMDFINETQRKVVTASTSATASSKIRRDPPTRHIEFTYSPKEKIKAIDTARVIRQYRNRSLKQQPRPMYVIVYNQMGRPTGTILVGPCKNFKNELLHKMKKSSVDFTEPVSFVNEQEMKSSPLNGIPRTISVGGMTYQPESVSGGDMCLYHGPQDYIVKFVDGRSQIFPGRPTFRKMRQLNFPVPTKRYRWTTIPENYLKQPKPHIPEEEPKEAAYEDSEKLKNTVQAESVDKVTKDLVYLKPMKTYDDLVPLDILKKRLLRDKLADRPIFEGKMVIDRIGHRGVYEGQFKLIIPQYFIRRYGVQRDDGTFSVYHLRRDGKARRVGLRPVPAEEFREAKPIGEDDANASGAV